MYMFEFFIRIVGALTKGSFFQISNAFSIHIFKNQSMYKYVLTTKVAAS